MRRNLTNMIYGAENLRKINEGLTKGLNTKTSQKEKDDIKKIRQIKWKAHNMCRLKKTKRKGKSTQYAGHIIK